MKELRRFETEAQDGKLAHQRLRVWHAAQALVRLVHEKGIGHSELRNQAERASVSAALGIAEGAALDGASRKRHFRIARASAVEVVAAYELAAAIGEHVPLVDVQELAEIIAGMLTRMIR
jgi:four helix bundle protein